MEKDTDDLVNNTRDFYYMSLYIQRNSLEKSMNLFFDAIAKDDIKYTQLVERLKIVWNEGVIIRGHICQPEFANFVAEQIDQLPEYLSSYFPFRKSAITIEKVTILGSDDIKITLSYVYSANELNLIRESKNSVKSPKEKSIEQLCNLLLYCATSTYAVMIYSEIFINPYSFQPENFESEWIDDNMKTTISVHGRQP